MVGAALIGPLSSEGSFSCHTCCDTGLRFFRSYPKDRTIHSLITTYKRMLRTYSYPYPHGFCGAIKILQMLSTLVKVEFLLRAHGGCGRSLEAEHAYSSMTPDPTFASAGGPCCLTLDSDKFIFGVGLL
jgi:hypothetical protein